MVIEHPDLMWVDLETTGLDEKEHDILEVAMIVTDGHLNIIAEMDPIVIHLSPQALWKMNDWCVEQHTKSGLIDLVNKSDVSLVHAERAMIVFAKKHCDPRKSPLCGNTIDFDRRFLTKYMPKFHEYFHYRSINVSSVGELVRRWYPMAPSPAIKRVAHRAHDDIMGSIEILRHYRHVAFK